MKQLIRYLIWFLLLFAGYNSQAQNNTVYGAGISYTNGAPTWTPNPRTSRAAVDTVTGRWYHFNTPGGWQWIGNTVEEIAGCAAPAYTPSKGDSRLVINNCVKPQVYWYDGASWKWINEGTTYFAGEGIRIENDTIILDSLNFLDFRTGNALDGDVGRVQWNDTDGTLDLNLKGGNVTLQIGQEEVSLVKHADNSGLIEGRVVYIVGSDGANKTVRYAKADSDATSATTFGLMTESATGGNKAFCTTFGLVRNLNTTNLTEGGIVWLSADTAGTMTAVRPTAPEHGVMIGFCVRKHATQGAIFVQVQNGYELNELHDVFVPSPTNGQVLTWNSTNARWEAITPANQLQTLSTDNTPGNISISSGNTITLNVNDADASATNELQTLSVAANTATLSNSGGSVTIAGAGINTVGTAGTTITVTGTEVDGSTTNELQTLSVAANTATLSNSGGSVTIAGAGINTVGTAGTTITVTGTEVDGSTTNELQTLSTGTNTLTLSNGGGTVTVDTDPSTDITGSGANGQITYFTGAQTVTSETALQWDAVNDRLGISTIPSNKLQIQANIDGPDGIFVRNSSTGTLSSAYFTVVNDLNRGMQLFAYGSNHSVFPNAVNLFTNSNDVSQLNFIARNHRIGFWTNVTERMRILATGEVGINQTAPAAKLHVVGSGTSSSTWTAQFHNSAGNNNALMIRDDGNVGIGTSTMNGRLNFTDNGSFGLYGTGTSPNYLAGSLGIGITAPRTALEVNADQIISTSNVWTSRASAADNDWRSIAYGNGLFVAVSRTGTGNRVMTSPDGINWTSRANAIDSDWFGVTYGNGLFVAVAFTGTGNRVMTSPDGINWTSRTSASNNEWRSIAYGNGLFVAVSASGTNNRVMTSPDGINWTSRTSASNNEWYSVTYGNGLFVAVSATGTGNRVMTSPDGINWTSRASATENEWVSVTYGNGLFVAVSATGTGNRVMTSPDGINWTSRTSASNNEWRSIAYGNGLFVVVSRTGTGNRVMTSPDGINWTSRTSAADNDWRSIAYGNGLFVAVSATGTGNRVMTSGKVLQIEPANNNIYQGNTRFTGQAIIGTTTQDASSAFEVASTTQGILFPRMTTAQRDLIATPANGLVIYNSTTDKLQVRAGGAWVDLH